MPPPPPILSLSLSLTLSLSLSLSLSVGRSGFRNYRATRGATRRFPLSRRGAQLTSSIYSQVTHRYSGTHRFLSPLIALPSRAPLLIGSRTNAATAIDGRVFRAHDPSFV